MAVNNNVIRMATENEVKYIHENTKNFKNRIINGDFSVRQRGVNTLSNQQEFILDRFQTQTHGSTIVGKDLLVLPNSISLVDNVDPFGDGSGVALYKLDGNALDAGGNYNGTWSGIEQYDTGIFGQAGKCTNDNRIIFMSNYYFPTIVAVSLWVKATRENNCIINFVNSNGSRVDLYYWGLDSTPSIGLNTWNNDCYGVKYTCPDEFIHIVAVFDFSNFNNFKIWINSEEQLCEQIKGNMSYTSISNVIKMETYSEGTTQSYTGLIDQVRIFNRVLTNDEIKKLYLEESQIIENPHYITLKTSNKPSDYTTQTIKHLVYRFEGQHLYDLVEKGSKVSVSFDFSAKKPGNYSVALINKTTSTYETLLQTFNYSGNQDEKVSVTFDLSQFQNKIRNDENLACELVIAGYTQDTNLVGNIGHNTGEKICTSDCIDIDNNDTISISKVQLEEGDTATEFEHIPYDIQLQRCMRYYEVLRGIFPAYVNSSNTIVCTIPMFPKRAAPTLKTDFSTANREPNDQTDLTVFGGIYSLAKPNTSGISFDIKCSTNLTVGNSVDCSGIEFYYLELDAEL